MQTSTASAAAAAAAPPPPAPAPDDAVLLHGDLDLTIHEARGLPNMDLLSSLVRRCLTTCLRPLASRRPRLRSPDSDHPHPHHRHPPLPTSDPYAKVLVAGATIARTPVFPNSQSPVWSTRFRIPLAHSAAAISFEVKDADPFGADLIGIASLPAATLLAAGAAGVKLWLPILRPDGRGPVRPDAEICVSAAFAPARAEAPGGAVAYFPERRGCGVALFQDAHVRDGDLPGVELAAGRCWEEVCRAVLEAQRLVYVAGWSVNTAVRLVREGMSPEMEAAAATVAAAGGGRVEEMTLGQLLKYKSEEGVRVCLLVWDDKTSHDTFLIRTKGLMQTHDESTKKFFKHSSVICVLSPRYPSSKLSMIKQKVVGTLYTHHQKCLLVDTAATGNMRKITAFLGGLDLCDGRYDTPQHRLFDGLDTVFKGDFHNPTLGADTKGPRQPWHDLHCRVEGPAAYDVLENFEQRWRRATRWRELFGVKSHWKDDSLLKLDRISWILSPSRIVPKDDRSLWVSPEDHPECWHAQIFRSIDSGSVRGFPACQKAAEENLICDKNVVVEQSIHTAYIKAIRSAQHFIYIENQYFIGSSYAWPTYKHPGASNLVPMEIALKVASKIRAGERFAVYIVIPMWPEGDPNSGPVQEILYWQSQTMRMMYEVIAGELKSLKMENAHPQDYLNFYCLGNREPANSVKSYDPPDSKSPAALARKHGRFMIYVHSKGLIVDDEYVMLGSANINQRSLAGSRDTELNMGSYQPHHTWAALNNTHPHGQVYRYRMSLWAEHLGMQHSLFENPEALDCVRLVNQIADANWKQYAAEAPSAPLQGHLLRYPVDVGVGADGRVQLLPRCEFFPDAGGRVLGSTNNLPDTLTM